MVIQQHGWVPKPLYWAKEARHKKINVGLHLCEVPEWAKLRNHNSVGPGAREEGVSGKGQWGNFLR